MKRKDEGTGLHYNRYRYYEPHSGRYISKDPIGLEGGLNNSAYVSDPNQWVNPLGLNRKTYKWIDENGSQVITNNEMRALEAYEQGINVDGYNPQIIGSRYTTRTNNSAPSASPNDFDKKYGQWRIQTEVNNASVDRGSEHVDQILNQRNTEPYVYQVSAKESKPSFVESMNERARNQTTFRSRRATLDEKVNSMNSYGDDPRRHGCKDACQMYDYLSCTAGLGGQTVGIVKT